MMLIKRIEFLTISSSLLLLLFFPQLPLFFFAPYLALIGLRNSGQNLLLQAVVFGAIVDLFSSRTFGVYISSYLVGALGVSLHARSLVYNKWTTLPLLTALFAIYCSIAQFFWYSLKGGFFWLEPKYFITEVFFTSVFDMSFAIALLLLHTVINQKVKVKR